MTSCAPLVVTVLAVIAGRADAAGDPCDPNYDYSQMVQNSEVICTDWMNLHNCFSTWPLACGVDHPSGTSYNNIPFLALYSPPNSNSVDCRAKCSASSDPCNTKPDSNQFKCTDWISMYGCDTTWMEACKSEHPDGAQYNDVPMSSKDSSQDCRSCSKDPCEAMVAGADLECDDWITKYGCDTTWSNTCKKDLPEGKGLESSNTKIKSACVEQCSNAHALKLSPVASLTAASLLAAVLAAV